MKSKQMNKARTEKEAVNRIRCFKPKTIEDFARIGVPLDVQPFSAGAFREVWMPRNKKLQIIVKFPVMENGSMNSGRIHSNDEVKKITRLRRYRLLRPHLPEVYYHDKKTGILVMRYYAPVPPGEEPDDFMRLGALTGRLIQRLTGSPMDDIQQSNIRGDGASGFVFIDLGY